MEMKMSYKQYLIGLIASASMLLTACDKYLDVTPKGYTTLSTITNYDQWLNDSDQLGATATSELNKLADNVDNVNIKLPATSALDRAYLWEEQLNTDVKNAPAFWAAHYANINKYNTVLIGVDAATGGTEAQKKALKAEALLGRAFEYLYLVNLYGKPYDSATAAQDLGVPFVTSNDVAQQVPDRSTVQQIYDQIIRDIDAALPDLPKDNSKSRMRGSVAAAYSVLARVYLYMGNYVEAGKNATLALQMPNLSMMDYRDAIPSSVSSLSIRPDAIYARRLMAYEVVDSSFVKAFNPADSRLKTFYFRPADMRGQTLFMPMITGAYALGSTNTGTSMSEMKLIVAEAAARVGDVATALEQINDIRTVRFAIDDYQPLASTDKDEVLQWVLRERRFELPYNGLRWFDMRRLDKEGGMSEVKRYDATGKVIATLSQHARAYTLQIPLAVSLFNPNMKLN
jgi:RagB/SusD domain-containing protein